MVESVNGQINVNNPSTGYLNSQNPSYIKKSKYILKDENERPKNQQQQPARRGMISIDHHGQPLKSMNHVGKKADLQRNKSVIGKDKIFGHGKQQQLGNSERESFNKNYSAVVPKKQIKDINVHINNRGLREECEWEKALGRFKKWSPSVHNFGEMSQLFEDMVRLIMKEEVELADSHCSLLVQEERNQKELASLYHETQN